MLRHHYGALLAILLVPMLAPGAHAQTLDAALAKLESPDGSVREAAFYEMIGYAPDGDGPPVQRLLDQQPGSRDRMAVALIGLMKRENARFHLDRGFPAFTSERDGEYYGDLIWAVASLRDPRAAEVLAPALGNGRIAVRGMADLGEAALPSLFEALRNSRQFVRGGAAEALREIAGRRRDLRIDSAGMAALKDGLLTAARDDDGTVRLAAVQALMPIPDPDLRPVMVQLASTDPYVLMRGGNSSYPVREAAQRWLDEHGAN